MKWKRLTGKQKTTVYSSFGYDHEIMVIIKYTHLDMHTEHQVCSIVLKTIQLPAMYLTQDLCFPIQNIFLIHKCL
jgi:hypothetical protein